MDGLLFDCYRSLRFISQNGIAIREVKLVNNDTSAKTKESIFDCIDTEPTVAEILGKGKVVPISSEESEPVKYMPRFPVIAPNPLDCGVIVTGEKGKISLSKNGIITYLERCFIIYNNKTPMKFNGYFYEIIDDDTVSQHIYDAIDGCRVPSLDCPSKSFVSDIIAKYKCTHFFATMPYPVEADFSDYETVGGNGLIPFKNGILNIETGAFLPFTPYVFLTYQLDVEYRPDILSHEVEKIYKGIIPDEITREFFYQLAGYTMFSLQITVPAIFMIYGGGNTGKSALQEVVASIIGRDHVSTLGLNQISGDFTTFMMEGKLANFCGETGDRSKEATKIDGELIKRLAEGQTITVQKKHGQPYPMTPTAKLWFVSNTMPDFGDSSSGLLRRLYIIPCRQTQSWKAQIYKVMQEPEAKSWLVNQALYWYRKFLADGKVFRTSPEMDKEKAQYTIQDNLMDFITTYFDTFDKARISILLDGKVSSELYSDYADYTQSLGAKPFSRKKFVERIRNEYNMELKTVSYSLGDKKTSRQIYVPKL